jgi:hypothetical protein
MTSVNDHGREPFRKGNHGCGNGCGWCMCCAVEPGDRAAIVARIRKLYASRLRLAEEMYPEISVLATFNDHPLTTEAEVLEILQSLEITSD